MIADLFKGTDSQAKTGVIQGKRDKYGNVTVKASGQEIRARVLGETPQINSRVVIVEANHQLFVVGGDDLRKHITTEYIIDG